VRVSLEGRPGEVRCVATAPALVRSERSGGDLRIIVSCSTVGPVAQGLEKVYKPVPGGIAIDVPMSADPSFLWQPSGVTIRWNVTGKPVVTDAAGLFATQEPPEYPLGPGDKLQLKVYNVEGMDQTVVVDPAGYLTFPVLDKVLVKGLTLNQLQQRFEELLAKYVKDPQVSVQLIEYGSRYVNVLGEVGNPGRIPLKGAYRVLDAVSQAGGFTDKSGDVEIQRRDESGTLQSKILTHEELLSGSSEKFNIFVKDQDVINVQPVKSVYVTGEVKKPGSFPYNKDMTLLRAITLAGGFDQWAKKDKVDILREEKGGQKTLQVDATKIEKGKIPDVPLMPNDQIVVRERKFF
jgi:polysaccharide export outer membrane protein